MVRWVTLAVMGLTCTLAQAADRRVDATTLSGKMIFGYQRLVFLSTQSRRIGTLGEFRSWDRDGRYVAGRERVIISGPMQEPDENPLGATSGFL
jgi:hypothetical protein